MDPAKAHALGADLVGLAGPFLRAAAQGEDEVIALATEMIEVLRVVMFCVGAPTIGTLRQSPRLIAVDGPGGGFDVSELAVDGHRAIRSR
jgi:isopentenyl-diphosphate delta-isomerase